MRQAYDDLMIAFAQHVGLDPEIFGRTQELLIDDVTVGLMYEGDEDMGDLLYFTQLGAPAEHRRADVHRVMLEANNLWVGTGGATLGIQPETGNVVLAGRQPVEGVTAEGLALLMDAFADTAAYWRRVIRDEVAEGDPAPPSPHMLRA